MTPTHVSKASTIRFLQKQLHELSVLNPALWTKCQERLTMRRGLFRQTSIVRPPLRDACDWEPKYLLNRNQQKRLISERGVTCVAQAHANMFPITNRSEQYERLETWRRGAAGRKDHETRNTDHGPSSCGLARTCESLLLVKTLN